MAKKKKVLNTKTGADLRAPNTVIQVPPGTLVPKTKGNPQYTMYVVGDLHWRRTDPLGRIGKDGLNSRLKDKRDALQTMVKKAVEEKATHLVLLGDIFDAINPPETLRRLFWETLAPALKAKIQIRIVTGNHDHTGHSFNLSGEQVILSAVDATQVQVIESPKTEEINLAPAAPPVRENSVRIQYVPHDKGEEILKVLSEAKEFDPDILFGHFEIAGAELAPDNCNIREGMNKDDVPGKVIWLGHIHKFQEFRKGFAFLGSTVKCDFGEVTNRKVYGVLEVYGDGNMKWEYRDIPQRPMYQQEIREEDVNNLYARESMPPEYLGNGVLLKFIFKGSSEWLRTIDKERFRRNFPDAMKVEIATVKVGTDRERTGEASSTMEDRVHTYNTAKKKGKECLGVGLELTGKAMETVID